MGWGTFVKRGAVLRRGELVGAYFGHVGSRSGPYVAFLEALVIRGRGRWEPGFDGEALAREGVISPAAIYNHSCNNATVYRKQFGSGNLRCTLFFAKKRLEGDTHLASGTTADITLSRSGRRRSWRVGRLDRVGAGRTRGARSRRGC